MAWVPERWHCGSRCDSATEQARHDCLLGSGLIPFLLHQPIGSNLADEDSSRFPNGMFLTVRELLRTIRFGCASLAGRAILG